MKKISRKRFEELKQKHYELWDWLGKHPDKSKDDWFKLDENKGLDIACNCLLNKLLRKLEETEYKNICCMGGVIIAK